jgi:hypothetical protein
MAAAVILKAVGHFRCCIFDYGWKKEIIHQISLEVDEN